MQTDQATALFQFLMPQVDQEQYVTRRVVEAIPADRGDYSPDPVSKNALDLAWHLMSSEIWFLDGIAKGSFEMGEPERPASIKTSADVLAWYDKAFPPAAAKLKEMSPEALAKDVDFFGMGEFPMVTFLQFMIKHTVHHRGQLSAYLRAMGSKVPSIYGGSADEPFQAAAGQ